MQFTKFMHSYHEFMKSMHFIKNSAIYEILAVHEIKAIHVM